MVDLFPGKNIYIYGKGVLQNFHFPRILWDLPFCLRRSFVHVSLKVTTGRRPNRAGNGHAFEGWNTNRRMGSS